ncbi:hypothetical protein C8Q79DRAFT_986366 [Trametes meyenii]|nr:hypothetical protein C8Q79DRAFT_986366 [Trametes meyenii]
MTDPSIAHSCFFDELPGDAFEHMISIPFECSATQHFLPTPEHRPYALGDDVDWTLIFARPTSVPPLSPPTVCSDHSVFPLTPVSDATCFDDFLPAAMDDSWMGPNGSSDGPFRFGSTSYPADDLLKEFTFAYEYDAPPSPVCFPRLFVVRFVLSLYQLQLAIVVQSPDGTATSPTRPLSPDPLKRKRSVIEDIKVVEPPKRATKRRRRQDTTPRHKCEDCEKLFARKHNLVVHTNTKHGGERPFVCKAQGCGHAFGRKHDLERHHQSKHTNLGSPRRKLVRQ